MRLFNALLRTKTALLAVQRLTGESHFAAKRAAMPLGLRAVAGFLLIEHHGETAAVTFHRFCINSCPPYWLAFVMALYKRAGGSLSRLQLNFCLKFKQRRYKYPR